MPTPYDFLVAGTRFRVIDVETTTHEGVRWIVALAIVEINDGLTETVHSWQINPLAPIDPVSQSIHGISDQDVADAPTFEDVSADIYDVLTNQGACDTIWVAHNATFDTRALAREFNRSAMVFPDLPVIDTLALPETLGRNNLAGLKLPTLADALGISGLVHHDPISDATVTAQCLLNLLREAHTAGITDIPGLLAAHGGRTTLTLIETMGDVDEVLKFSHPVQPAEHLSAHLHSLPDLSAASVRLWARKFIECAEAGCEYTRDLAAMIDDHPGVFLTRLKALVSNNPPDRLGLNTTLGAITPLVEAGAVSSKTVFTWWVAMTKPGPVACPPEGSQCPDCREDKPCPADVFYQRAAAVLCGKHRSGFVPSSVIQTHARSDRQLKSWIDRGGIKIAGYVAWACIEQAGANLDPVAAGKLRDTVSTLRLDEIEPRLTLQTATRLVADGHTGQARQLVDYMLDRATSDPGFQALREFQTAHLCEVPEPAPRVLRTKPRPSVRNRRPPGRVEPPRFKL